MESHLHIVLLSVGVLLAAARLLGEVTKQLGLTALLGEILAGILLGPTVLGRIAPEAGDVLFPTSGTGAAFWESMTGIAVAMFLLVSGMEVNLSAVVRQRRAAIAIGVTGLLVPFFLGFAGAGLFPSFLGSGPGSDPMIFSLFIGTALSISALPVIAKILLELNLYRTDLGMIVMPAAVLQDLIGWCVFAVITGLLDVNPQFSVGTTVGLMLLFTALMLTVGRYLFDRLMTVIRARWTWPGGIVGFGVAATLLASVGKIGGSLIGGQIAGLSRRDSLAVGYAMNARGAMEIILGLAALRLQVISEKTFVALVVMAIVTSLMSGH